MVLKMNLERNLNQKQSIIGKIEKTLVNKYYNLNNKVPKKGKYTLVELDYNEEEEEKKEEKEEKKEEKEEKQEKKKIESKLDKRVQELIKLISNVKLMNETLQEFNIVKII
jgi:poly [ADP-ribose] polymerase